MIHCRDLSVQRQGRRVLDGVSLDLHAGERWVLWGGNGAGKTTLARTLAGFVRPASGELSWAEGLIPPLPLLFQDPDAQIAAASVRDEVALGARAAGEPFIRRDEPGPAGRRLAAALQHFRLEGLQRRNPHSLSGGEKRRLNLAALSVLESPVLILDEPELHLDGPAWTEWTVLLDGWVAAGERCVLEISHEASRVREADGLAVLHEGRLVGVGRPREVYQSLRGKDLPLPRVPEWESAPPSGALAGDEPWAEHGEVEFTTEAPETSTEAAAIIQARRQARELLKAHGERVPVLEASGLVLKRPGGGRPVLDGVDLELRSLDRVLLTGGNGCGKTSLLLLLARLADPDQGRVDFLSVRETGPHAVMAFQEPERGCFAESVAEELSFGLKRHGIVGAEAEHRMTKALSSLGLGSGGILDRDPFALSEGELRRVALASVLVLAPRVLLLDEPAASLDRAGRIHLREALEGFGGALVWADHRMPAEYGQFFDRRLVLEEGSLVEEERMHA